MIRTTRVRRLRRQPSPFTAPSTRPTTAGPDPIPSGPWRNSPLTDADSLALSVPVPFATDTSGNDVTLTLTGNAVMIAGGPESGVTSTARLLSAAAALDPIARLYVADGFGGTSWKPVNVMAQRLIMGADETAVYDLHEVLDELVAEMHNRYQMLRHLPADVDARDPDQAAVLRPLMPPILLVLDDAQEYLAAADTPRVSDGITSRLIHLARGGREVAITLVIAAHDVDYCVMPSALRDAFTIRLCTRTLRSPFEHQVLGDQPARRFGETDTRTLPPEVPGLAVLATSTSWPQVVRRDRLDRDAFAGVCERGQTLRLAALA
jgi:hypothetical protein